MIGFEVYKYYNIIIIDNDFVIFLIQFKKLKS